MTKFVELAWKRPVDKVLIDGSECDKWTEEKESNDWESGVTFKVDDDGFFLAWKGKGKEGEVLELSTVNDIRNGTRPNDEALHAKLKGKHGDKYMEKSVCVCSGMDMVNVNLINIIFKDNDVQQKWAKGLRSLIMNVKMNNACPKVNLRKHHKRLLLTDTVDGKCSVKVIVKTFASGKTEQLVYDTLAKLGLPSEKGASMPKDDFTFDKFYEIYKTICPRTDIDALYSSITKLEAIPVGKMIEWMNDKQRDPRLNQMLYPCYTEKRLMEIVNRYEKDPENVKKKQLSKKALTEYMLSDENSPIILDRLEIYQEMNQPLNHYYINSSHNTYLTGKQFGGKSSVEIYRQVLLSGCRCVELDCWDGKGSDDGEVIITHGKAMCTNVYFKDCIQAIADTAFQASDYPVILSLENHCNRNNQEKMAKYCQKAFGSLLGKDPLKSHPLKKGQCLPPPNKLLKKILLKNKRLKPEQEKAELAMYMKGQLQIGEEESEDTAADAPKVDPGADPAKQAPPAYSGSTAIVHPLLSSFVNYTHPQKFQGFDEAEKQDLHFKMSSFAEPAALGYLKQQSIEFVNYNKRQNSRIYPKGARVDSSNMMPQIFWNAGCQMVALNFQTPDLPMQLNQGKFEYNGNCGYLLKPEFMRRNDKTFDPFSETAVDGVCAAECNVSVISGLFLSDKRVGTYVEVDLYGLPSDTIRKEHRTKVVPANGLNPMYNEDPFAFRKVVLPDLAVLMFSVYNESGKLLGQRTLPFNDLQAGYRHISLKTEGNFPMSLPMLFCNIELKIYVPDGLGDFMDALCDPRAFLSAQEKRAEQLKAMGIEESDISENVIVKGPSAGVGGEKKPGEKGDPKAAGGKGKEEKKPEWKVEPINCETLRDEKAFIKATKKQGKEYENLQKKHDKERQKVQTNQCNAIEKLAAKKGGDDIEKDPEILALVQKQTEQWTEMVNRHKKEEWELLKVQLKSQEETFKNIMPVVQAKQLKDMEAHFVKETKDMTSAQSKMSVDTAKEVAADPKLKTKAEKDRRLKEKNAANTKKFIDERKNTTLNQNKTREKTKKNHEKQLTEISSFISDTVAMYEVQEHEIALAAKREAYV